jgi:Uma2 family endonuclease
MTLAIDRFIEQKPLTFDEFLARYGGDNRFELIDGEVFDLEPTGQHERVAGFINTKVCVQIDRAGLPWFVLQRPLFRPANEGITAFWPDIAVIDEVALAVEGDVYKVQRLTGDDAIVSPTFPGLKLTAAQVLRAGR